MSGLHYLSMNSSLAQIFADDEELNVEDESWEKDNFLERAKIKEESKNGDDEDSEESEEKTAEESFYSVIQVKQEPEEAAAKSSDEEWEDGEYSESEEETIDESYYALAKVKQEPEEVDCKQIKQKQEVDLSKVKQESVKVKKEECAKRILKRVHDDGNNAEGNNCRQKSSGSVSSSCSDNNNRKRRKVEYETDAEVLKRRQKQIDYGKNTRGYDNYLSQVPKNERKKTDPMTPNKYLRYSRRAWDGLIKQWRIKLHHYDPSL